MADVRMATTLLLVRTKSAGGLEIFMVQRHRNSGFLPNAWVFPGGRVDPTDTIDGNPGVIGGDRVAERWTIPREQTIAHLVAGVRETFEECGIWLGSRTPPPEDRVRLTSGQITIGDLLASTGATMALDRLLPWSWWVTPVVEKRRYDTRFLLAVVDGEAIGSHDDHETVASGWFDPAAIAAEATLGTFPLAPPTWWTLRELASYETIEAVSAASLERSDRPIQPILEFRSEGTLLLLPGHPEHPEPAIPGLPTHVVYENDRWVAQNASLSIPTLPGLPGS